MKFLSWFLDLFRKPTPKDPIEQIAASIEVRPEDLNELELRQQQEERVISIDLSKYPIPQLVGSKTAYHKRGDRANIAVEIPMFDNGDKIEIRAEPKDINKRLWILADRRSWQPGRYQQMPV